MPRVIRLVEATIACDTSGDAGGTVDAIEMENGEEYAGLTGSKSAQIGSPSPWIKVPIDH